MIPPLKFPDLTSFFEFPNLERRRPYDEFGDEDDEEYEEEDDDDDEEDEMEQIGRLPSLNQISLEYYHWLWARYLGNILSSWKQDEDDAVDEDGYNSAEDAAMTDRAQMDLGLTSSSADLHDHDEPTSSSHVPLESGDGSSSEKATIASLTDLRQRILEIKALNLPDRERDKRVQRLMTETYYKLHPPISEQVEVTNKDCAPTYHEEGILGCPHYRRRCKLECSTCYRWYTCRFCHDDDIPEHKLIRPQTRHMLCMNCGTAQDAAQNCRSCKLQMARYYCDTCKLWDDDPIKNIYHCDDCGICRIGRGLGVDFFHCATCNMCMSIELQDNHKCIEHSTECDCPICGEFMFTSTETVIFMRCGHSIHQSCFIEHTKSSYRCPVCARSILNMEAQFRILDTEIANQVLPEPYCNWRSIIICNDCSAKSNTSFHFLGLKCQTCKSYNTGQITLIKPEEEDEEGHHEVGSQDLSPEEAASLEEATRSLGFSSSDECEE